jgi:hypothetical protein
MNETGGRLGKQTGGFLEGSRKSPGLGQDEASGSAPKPYLSPAAIVFAVLVAATVGAFFVTTRLKRSAPVIERLTFNRHFSPNDDGRADTVVFALRLRRTDDVTVSIVTRDGSQIQTLADDLAVRRGRRYRFRWDGRTADGRVAPDGEYHVRVSLRRQGRVVTSGRKVFLDTTAPRPVVGYVRPTVITPGAHGRAGGATLRYSGPKRSPELFVYRTDLPRPRLVARQVAASGTGVLHWDGRVGLGSVHRLAAAGTYLVAVRVRDAAGNLGPKTLPPRRGAVPGHPGVTVRYLAAEAPQRPVRAGALTSFRVFGAGRRYRWRLRRLGSPRTLSRGASRSGILRLHAPRGPSGVALLELRAGSHAYETPFAVRARKRQRVLIVLPAITWQGGNPVEENGDGYPDVLPLDRVVGLHRPFAGRGRPPGFATTAALLAYLRSAHLHYEVTTDLAIARDGEASLRRHSGVLIAGSARFAPTAFTRALASYVKGGGRLAWIGTRGFARAVDVSGRTIVRGRAGTFLGERVRIESGPQALAVLGDRIDFFRGVNSAFGPFPRLEPSLRLPVGARLLASAGADPRRPDLVVYRFERGVVVRVGIDGFGPALALGGASSSVARIMPRLWALLSR